MKRIKNDPTEGFVEMLARMDNEDHGKMTKDEWDTLKAKWMNVYTEFKLKAKSPLLFTWEDIQEMK